jgi:hypothetical protein
LTALATECKHLAFLMNLLARYGRSANRAFHKIETEELATCSAERRRGVKSHQRHPESDLSGE